MPSFLLRLVALLCFVMWLPADAGAQPASITLAMARSPLTLPVRVAEAEGYFAAEGLRVRMAECASGRRCLGLLLDGQADVATAADTALMFASFDSGDLALLATVAHTRDDVKLVGRRSAGIRLPRDLVGKKVGVLRGTSAHYFLDAYLLFHGIDPGSVQTVALQPEQTTAALQAREVDAVALWEPLAHKATLALGDDAVTLKDDGGVYVETFNLVAHRRMVGTRDADLAALLRAVARAQALIRRDPEKARALLQRSLDLSPAFVSAAWPGLRFGLTLDQGVLRTMESEARWALREGHVKGAAIPNMLSLVHSAPLRAVLPDAVGLAR
jgi:NitT/TauT family transport system substrate-binding protein